MQRLPGPYLVGGGGGAWVGGQLPPLEIRQIDYNALISVISANNRNYISTVLHIFESQYILKIQNVKSCNFLDK